MFKRIKVRTNILIHFLFVLLMIALALIGLQYYFSKQMAREAVSKTFHQTAHKIALTLKDEDRLSKEVLYQIEHHPAIDIKVDRSLPIHTVKHFIHTLKRYENMYAIYLGFDNGDFFEVINMNLNPHMHTHYQAPKQTRWSIIKIYNQGENRVREFIFLDDNLTILGKRVEDSIYTVITRPWYKEALLAKNAVRSDPYLFTNLQQKGITYAKKIQQSTTVLALDFTLESIHKTLSSLRFSPTGNIYLYGRDGQVISSTEESNSSLKKALQKMLENHKIDVIKSVTQKGKTYYAMVIPLTDELGKKTYIGTSVAQDEMLSPYKEQIYYAIAVAFILLIMFIPVILYLTDHIVSPIRALMAENEMIKKRSFDKVKPIETNIIEFIELSKSQIAMSQSIREYQKQLETLLDSFIKLIADAIDAKSSYTGSHCKKVPIIATMLADAAEASNEGAFKTFRFESDETRTAFERAAWLHDCGKITTPEYVVDKSTKLETIYNRIHEIRTRFEILWRDIEITYYERLIAGEEKSSLDQWKAEQQEKLQNDFSFVASCNVGSELMQEEKVIRLKELAKQTWQRHFDDRLGLSQEELKRYGEKSEILPVKEYLISDRQEHLIARDGFDKKNYEAEGFKEAVPQWLYNRGELYNLCVIKGTLTEEERYKINEHVIMTIKMLERLPFPPSMAQIPQFAGEHHETMDGQGYPRKLTKEELSIPSRIMAIADIFEALTASDRPYKKAKTLSEALKIMYVMKKESHIDAELFNLFILSKVYLRYAQTYLHPEQIDEVDEEMLLG